MPLASTSRTIRYQREPKQGRGIASVSAEWAASASPDSAPDYGWQSAPPALSQQARFLWQRLAYAFTDGTSQQCQPTLVGSLGEDGVGSYSIDLSNEMAAVGLVARDGSLYPVDGFCSVHTQASAIGGRGEARISGCELWAAGARLGGSGIPADGPAAEARGIAGFECSVSGGVASVDIDFDPDFPRASGETMPMEVRCSLAVADGEGGAERSLWASKTLTAFFQPPGADGVSPTVYQLVPSPSSIVADSACAIAPADRQPRCSVLAVSGSSQAAIDTPEALAAAGLSLAAIVDGSSYGAGSALAVSLPPAAHSLVWELRRDGALVDREDVPVIPAGREGDPAVAYAIVPSPAAVAFASDGTPSATSLRCAVVVSEGERQTVAASPADLPAGLSVTLLIDGSPYAGAMMATPPQSYSSAEWRLQRGSQTVASCPVAVTHDGAPGPKGDDGRGGEKGAKPRFLRWETLPSGFTLLSGAAGEEFYDIVQYGSALYLCTQSFVCSPFAIDPPRNHSLQPIDHWSFLATDLLIADRSVVDNLCANFIQMLDPDTGLRRFAAFINSQGQAEVYADHAHFADCAVSGVVTASQMRLSCVGLLGGETLTASFNTAVYFRDAPRQTTFFLAELAEGACQTIDVMVCGSVLPDAQDTVMTLQADTADVRIITGALVPPEGSADDTARDVEVRGRLGLYRITGWHEPGDSRTFWNVTLMDGVVPPTAVSPGRVVTRPTHDYRYDPTWGFTR